MRWISRWRHRLRGLLRRDAVERELDDELAYHLEQEIASNLRSGMTATEARRQAMIAFGGVEGHKEGVRSARTLGWLPGVSLDLKLAWRILLRHRWLSAVGGFGIAVAVAIGTLFFGVRSAVLYSALPFEEGERVVKLEVQEVETGDPHRRILHELSVWREKLRSVEDIGGWRDAPRNLVIPGGLVGPVRVAEISASAFRMSRVPAQLGRTLFEEDELPEAPDVAVLGFGLWQTRFGGDPDVVGREVRLGNAPHTVVGVMPEGFAFPVEHELWVPLKVAARSVAPGAGPEVQLFGRLAEGASMEAAAAELSMLPMESSADFPVPASLRARAAPYTEMGLEVVLAFVAAQTLTILLLIVVCVNVGILVHARTAARSRELALRTALGASRRRIIGQLFVESLVLALVSALVGLAIAWLVFRWADGWLDGGREGLPFWMQFGLSPAAVAYALILATASAAIVGVLPALKVTGRRLRSRLDRAGGGGHPRLGSSWTFQIVAQVAVATAVLPIAAFEGWDYFQAGFARADFPASEILTAGLGMEVGSVDEEEGDGAEAESVARFEDRVSALVGRLRTDPAVSHVTFAKHSPGGLMPATVVVDDLPLVDGEPRRQSVRTNEVDLDFFETLEVPVLRGRGFHTSDVAETANTVVVNLAFVEEVLGGRNALGRELRYLWRYGWSGDQPPPAAEDTLRRYEIVGVVGDQLVVGTDPGEAEAHVYHAATAGRLQTISILTRVRGPDATVFVPRLREMTTDLDPALQLHDIRSVDEGLQRERSAYRFVGGAVAIVALSVVLLSAAGIHALMSFIILRRRKEIGIRAALGTRPWQLLTGIFARAAAQIGIGLVVGLIAAHLLNSALQILTGNQVTIFFSVAASLMTIVGLLAALGPARRGLRIEPMEALRAE